MNEVRPKIERQEIWYREGGHDPFHAQAVPVFHPMGLIIAEPNKNHSWFIPYGSIRKAKLNVRPKFGGTKIVTPNSIIVEPKNK